MNKYFIEYTDRRRDNNTVHWIPLGREIAEDPTAAVKQAVGELSTEDFLFRITQEQEPKEEELTRLNAWLLQTGQKK